MAYGTVLVASPSATARTPVAIGSRVPAWPAFWASNTRFTMPTTWVEVMPSGLSTITQPWTGEPFFLRPIGVVLGTLVRFGEVLLHARGFEKRLDLLGFGEGLVFNEAQIGR